MSDPFVHTYTPAWATHVTGKYTERTINADGMPEEQRIEATCSTCGATWKGGCLTGMVREHIARFAYVHLHRDPLEDAKEKGR
ncbi:MAG: hypothetical protein PVSMB8_15250 [Vulcanimicrobiaceae bacterium]